LIYPESITAGQASRGSNPPAYDRRTGGLPQALQPTASSPCIASSCWLLGVKYPGSRSSHQKGGLRLHTGWPWILLRRGRVREFSATNVPHRSEQDSLSLRAGVPATFSPSAPGMKTLFDLLPDESAQGRTHTGLLTEPSRTSPPLNPIVSMLKPRVPQLEGNAEEFVNGRSATRKTRVSRSGTEPDELEGFQPSMLCTRSLPIYLLKTEPFPQLHSRYMRGLTTWK
jgi:hypothetical protein